MVRKVQVKVWLGEDMAHYYVLSRFLISRMLTVTKVPHQKAIKIALAVKKHLVDNDRLDITQASRGLLQLAQEAMQQPPTNELETILFSVMRSKGFGDAFIKRYKMVNHFFQQKRPLIILICGSACTGKSTFAQQLASRLNLSNVLQTDILYELLRTSGLSSLSSTPLWSREGLADDDLISEFQQECRIIRRGLDGDLCKSIKDGKPIIIEGLHLDPGLYLDEFGRHGMVGMAGAFSLELPQYDAAGPHMAATTSYVTTTTSAGSRLGESAAQGGPGPLFATDSVAASPPSPSGSLGSSHEDGGPAPTPYSSTPAPSSPVVGAGGGAHSFAEEDGLPARRSISFTEAATSGLASAPPAYDRQSPWRHLRPGGFLHRLLHRPKSAHERGGHQQQQRQQQPEQEQQQQQGQQPEQEQQQQHLAQALRGKDFRSLSLPEHSTAPGTRAAGLPSPLGSQRLQLLQQQQQQAGPPGPLGRGVMRTASLGQVTFMLQQDADAALSPVRVMPGSEVLVPAPVSPRLGQLSNSRTGPVGRSEGLGLTTHQVAGAGQEEEAVGRGTGKVQGSTQRPELAAALQDGAQQPEQQQQWQAQSSTARQAGLPHAPSPFSSIHAGSQRAPPPGETAKQGTGRFMGPPPAALNGSVALAAQAAADMPLASALPAEGSGSADAACKTPAAVEPPQTVPGAAEVPPGPGPGAQSGSQAAAAPAARDAQGPVFVPIVLAMDTKDYELVVQEWQAAQAGLLRELPAGAGGTDVLSGGGGGQASAAVVEAGEDEEEAPGSSEAVLRRLQVLQDYLRAYGAVGVPVVEVNVGGFHATLDKLHDYLLACIEMSL
ncbi:hypothetical protein N2152v2_006376 [Parachlorella kessleri]